MKIMIIEAYDHFTVNNKREKECVARIIGEFLEENDTYIVLSSFNRCITEDSGEYHNVLKSAIIKKKEIEVSLDEESG